MTGVGRIRLPGLAANQGGSRAASCLALTGALAFAGHGGLVLAQGTAAPEEPVAETAALPTALPTTIDQPTVGPFVEEDDPLAVQSTEPEVVEPVAVQPADPLVVNPVEPVGATDVFSDTIAPARTIGARVGGIGAASAPAGPQAPPAGPVLTFDLGVGVVAENGELSNRNSLGFSYRSETREQLLELSLRSAFDVTADGIDTEDVFPDADLAYARDTGVLLLRLSAAYSVADVNGSIPGPDFTFDSSDIVRDEGTRATTQYGFGFDINRREPVGLEFNSTYQSREYSGTSDPDLNDTENLTYQGALRLTFGPTLTFRLTALRRDIEKGGETETNEVETAYGTRMTWQARPATRVDLSLAHSRLETEENETIDVIDPETGLLVDRIPTGARLNSEQTGLVGDLSLTRELRNGTAGVSVGRELTTNGNVDRLAVSRGLNLANGADLRLSFGIASFEGSDTFPTVDLRYSQPLPLGQVTASLQSDGFVDDDNQNVTRTRATLGYSRPLTPLSDLSMSLGLASINVVDGLEADTVAADLLLGYSRQLDRNWSVNLGYQGTLSREDGVEDDSDTTVFVNLNRSFSIRP